MSLFVLGKRRSDQGAAWAIQMLRLNETTYAPFSFRIGGTMLLAVAGVPTYILSVLNLWHWTRIFCT